MLEVRNLTVGVEEKTILKDISLSFKAGETYALLGHNGSGKSSLAMTIAGHPKYKVTEGGIFLDGTDSTTETKQSSEEIHILSASERAQRGIFLAFQNVPEIRGVRLSEFLRSMYNEHLKRTSPDTKPFSPFLFKRFLTKEAASLGISESFFDRDLFVGFSGGEKRRIELLSMKLLDPKIVILDEIDSGLDIDAFELVADFITHFKKEGRTIIVISHNFEFLDRIGIDTTLVLAGGKLARSGGKELLVTLRNEGFSNM